MGAHLGEGLWDDDLRSVRESYLSNRGEFLVGTVGGQVVAMGGFAAPTRWPR